jgi:site-specific recombinase XerD
VLRPSFVSILGATGVRIEGVRELMGHSGMSVTEYVYRHEIRPVLPAGVTKLSMVRTAG